MKNLAIITARSGSKGLKDKNIKPLNGKPLIAYTIESAKLSGVFTEIMVSTDSSLYADVAKAYGASVPFLRSCELSGDHASSWDVVKEVLLRYNKDFGLCFDTVCLLQPTSPLRDAEDIRTGYQEFEEKKADAVTAVCEMDHSPLWSMTLPESLSLKEYREKGYSDIPRQQLPKYYRVNGALYIRKVNYSNNNTVFLLEKKEYAYIMPRTRSIDIDTLLDFKLAEFLLSESL